MMVREVDVSSVVWWVDGGVWIEVVGLKVMEEVDSSIREFES